LLVLSLVSLPAVSRQLEHPVLLVASVTLGCAVHNDGAFKLGHCLRHMSRHSMANTMMCSGPNCFCAACSLRATWHGFTLFEKHPDVFESLGGLGYCSRRFFAPEIRLLKKRTSKSIAFWGGSSFGFWAFQGF